MSETGWAYFAPHELQTELVGAELRFLKSTGSTNDLLKAAARAGAAEGLVLVADEQIAGRGRRGRSWTAPPGSSLLLSVLLRPGWLPAADTFLLTMLAAVSAAEALQAESGVAVELKWPNDLHVDGRKLGGILLETELSESQVAWAVLGCGVNINWDPRGIPELSTSATSLQLEHGAALPRRALLAALLRRLDTRYRMLRSGARDELYRSWRDRLNTLGRLVRAATPNGQIDGLAEDVAPDGCLLVRDDGGTLHSIAAGDVSLRAQ